MKKMLVTLVSAIVLCGVAVAEIDTADHQYTGKITFDTAADVRIRGGARLTATSDELNKMDGVTATADELNAAAFTVTGSIATNANGGTNVLTVTATRGGSVITTPYMVEMYTSDTYDGAVADGLDEVAIANGLLMQEITADAHELLVATNIVGTVSVTLTQTPGATNYVHIIGPDGIRKTYKNAFNTP
jgi:hypothetical protein